MLELVVLLAIVNRALSRAIDAYDNAADNGDEIAETVWRGRVIRLQSRQRQIRAAIVAGCL